MLTGADGRLVADGCGRSRLLDDTAWMRNKDAALRWNVAVPRLKTDDALSRRQEYAVAMLPCFVACPHYCWGLLTTFARRSKSISIPPTKPAIRL